MGFSPRSYIPPFASPLRLIVLLVVSHTSFGGARLAISLQALQQHASPLVVGMLMSLLMVVPTFVSVSVGRWVDRVGYLRAAGAALAGLIAGGVCAATVPGLPGLALASVLVGTSFSMTHVSVNHAIGHIAGAGRTRAFGLTAIGYSVSSLVGPMLAGAAIDGVGFSWTFVLLAVIALAGAALLWKAPPVPGSLAVAEGPRSGVGDLLRMPQLRAVLLVSAMMSAGWDLFTFLVPLHGARNGLSATSIGLVAGAFGIGSALVRLALPWIARRIAEWRMLGSAMVLAALGYVVFPFCTTVQTMLPMGFVLGMVLGCGQPVVMSLLHVSAPPSRTGEAVGLRTAITSLGQTVLPLTLGAFGSAVGLLPLFWAVAGVLGCGGAYAAGRRVIE